MLENNKKIKYNTSLLKNCNVRVTPMIKPTNEIFLNYSYGVYNDYESPFDMKNYLWFSNEENLKDE